MTRNEAERYGAQLSPSWFARVCSPTYQRPPHIRLLDSKLCAVERGEIKRLVVNVPPRHGKSSLISMYFPAWLLGKHPDWPIILSTYADSFASYWAVNKV